MSIIFLKQKMYKEKAKKEHKLMIKGYRYGCKTINIAKSICRLLEGALMLPITS